MKNFSTISEYQILCLAAHSLSEIMEPVARCANAGEEGFVKRYRKLKAQYDEISARISEIEKEHQAAT